MQERWSSLVVPAYLFACLLLGGSAQGVGANLVLQLAGLMILLWAVITPRPMDLAPAARPLAWMIGLAVALIVIQLLPLPVALWTILPGRPEVADTIKALRAPLAAAPLSLDPLATWATALQFIPPLAIVAGIVRLGAYRGPWLALAVGCGAVIGTLLGVAQVSSPNPQASPFYLYPQTNWGVATGFFANANHMGIALVCTIPFLAAAIARTKRERGRGSRRAQGIAFVAGAAALVIFVGLALNKSLAATVIAIPVIAASALIVLEGRRVRTGIVAATLVAMIALPVAISLLPRQASSTLSVDSRVEIARITVRAIAEYLPVGSGLGTFVRVYPRFENPATVGREYVVHAHDDVLELALETGVPGMLLLLAFVLWLGWRCLAVWRSPNAEPYACAGSIAAAALLAHSVVDYPLRTSAMAAVFAMSVALLAEARSRRRRFVAQSDPNPGAARHLTL